MRARLIGRGRRCSFPFRRKTKRVTTFTDLGLSAPLLKALTAEGYETPTPIQAQSIPDLLKGRDLLGIAQTGTGKTAAFALPIIQLLAARNDRPERRSCRTLILSPTRELAAQIHQSFRTYGRFHKLSYAVVYGGTSLGKQVASLQNGVDVLVATPGRLLDLIDRRAVSLNKLEIFVLDEADQMLDMGFIHDIRKITAMLPKKRQNLFFSATMPKEIAGLADALLHRSGPRRSDARRDHRRARSTRASSMSKRPTSCGFSPRCSAMPA